MMTQLVDTFILPEVQRELDTIVPKFNGRQEYDTKIKEWLSPIIDLTDFFVYPINGITEGLNWWQGKEERSVYKQDGDYQWISNSKTTSNDPGILYMTCPSAITGSYVDIPTDIPLVLDIAYVGSVPKQKINIGPNVEKVFFSLSKSFGIGNIRTGWYFTRRPDAKLHQIHIKSMYYNYCAFQYAEHLINTYGIDYVHTKLKDIQLQVCSEHNFMPSDCVWLATSPNDEYAAYRRGSSKIARLCITKLIKEQYYKERNMT